QLNLKLGDTVRLGEGTYTIRATLRTEPDRAVQIFSFGPRVMLSHASLAVSGLVNTFSLIEHRYRLRVPFAGGVNKAYAEMVKQTLARRFLDRSWQVSTGSDGNRMLRRFLDQLLSFLTLSGLATFLIAGIGIGSSVRAYLEKKSPTIAVLKVQGASRRIVLLTYLMVLAILALAGGVVGVVLAAGIISALLPLVTPILPILSDYGTLGIPPLVLALWYGILITYLFSIPALMSALEIRPALLFRSKAGILLFRPDRRIWRVTATLAFVLAYTLVMMAQDKHFMLGAMAVMLGAFLLFWLCALAVKWLARRIHVRRPWLKLALANLYRPGATTGTVIFAIGISPTVLIALTLTEANFQARIKRVAEEEAPSLFMMDIQPHQQEGLHRLLREYASDGRIMLYPMVRGRISAINGKPVVESDVDEEVRWAVRGDRGLSYSAVPPENASLIAGEWWPGDYAGPPLISVDSRFLDGMHLKLGDTLTLTILGEDITATVASARDIDYTTFQINFAMMLSPGVIDQFPHTYLATIHLGHQHAQEVALVKAITREFPGVTIIRTQQVVETVREMMHHIATALRVTVLISLLAGLMVLTSALSTTLEQRLYDTAVLKVLGARQADILKSCTTEWMLLAVITATIAAGIGTFSAWLIMERFRGQGFSVMPEVTGLTIAACMVVIWLTGYWGNRRLFRLRPASLLRNE
ncbi:MAG: FtsX-like permease family protein, partial [Rickettsiales bacterium]|nr:FtsX-like permease family protein [Rickettsiales bacterium]